MINSKKLKKNKNLIYGIHPVLEAVNQGKQFDKVLIRKLTGSSSNQELVRVLRQNKINFQFVPVEKLSRITNANHQGVIAFISPITYHQIDMLLPTVYESGKIPFILVLDHITDVRNFGAIVRTAECAGVDAVIIPRKGSVSITADAIKTSAGALNRIPVCRVDSISKVLEFLKQSGLIIIAASEKANEYFHNQDFSSPLALVMGAEDKGISKSALSVSDRLVKIPMMGQVSSLNVGVACGILLFEVVKQRHFIHPIAQ